MSQVDEVRFDNVQVPADAVLGAVEGAAGRAWNGGAAGFPILCAYQVGSCQAAFEMAVAYSRTRIQFGHRSAFPARADHIIGMVNHLDAARWTPMARCY